MGLLGCNWFKSSFGRLVLVRAGRKIPATTRDVDSLLRDAEGSLWELCA